MPDSIKVFNSNWQTVDGIVMPSSGQDPLLPYGMEEMPQTAKPAMFNKALWMRRDSIARAKRDSVTRAYNDSLAHIPSGYGLVIEAPYSQKIMPVATHQVGGGAGMSWLFAILGILFCLVCLKLKSSRGYLRTLINDTYEVRMRHNVFDNTVKETSFQILLMVSWICCTGILLWCLLDVFGGVPFEGSSRVFPDRPLISAGLCSAAITVYVIFIYLAYEITGNVFMDNSMTRMWIKGATAGMSIEVFLLFPLVLLALCYPEWVKEILIASGVVVLLGKFVFIYKGLRIFHQQLHSWLLFLCYLCSLEIVPLILTYLLAYQICVRWL